MLSGISGAYLSEAAHRSQAESAESILKSAAENGGDHTLMTACNEFEAYFLNVLFKEMRKAGFCEKKSNAEQTFQEMLDGEYAKLSAQSGGIGLAAFMYQQLKSNQ